MALLRPSKRCVRFLNYIILAALVLGMFTLSLVQERVDVWMSSMDLNPPIALNGIANSDETERANNGASSNGPAGKKPGKHETIEELNSEIQEAKRKQLAERLDNIVRLNKKLKDAKRGDSET